MASNNNGPRRQTLQSPWALGNTDKKEEKKGKEEVLRSIIPEHTKESVKKATSTPVKAKKTTSKKTTAAPAKTNTAPFKPRTLLETTIAESKDRTKQSTNNRFESRFTPKNKDVHSKRIKEIDDELHVLGTSLKTLKSNGEKIYPGESEARIKRYESRIAELRKEKESLVKSGVMLAQGHVKTMDSVSAVEDLKLLTKNDVESARVAEQKREKERKKRQEEDLAKAGEYWQKQKKQESDTTESNWRPEFDRSDKSSSIRDDAKAEIKELAKDPKKLKITEGSKEAEYYIKGWDESQKDNRNSFLYLDKRSDDDSEVSYYEVITQNEYDALLYIRGKYGKNEAEEYLRTSGIWDRKVKAEGDAKYREKLIQQAKEHPVASYLGTLVGSYLNAGVGLVKLGADTADKVLGTNINMTLDEADAFADILELENQGRLESTDNRFLKKAHEYGDVIVRELGENALAGQIGGVFGGGEKAMKAGEIIAGLGAGAGDKYGELAQNGVDINSNKAYIAVATSAVMDAYDMGIVRKGAGKLTKGVLGRMADGTLKTVLGNTMGSVLTGAGVGVTRQVIDNTVDRYVLKDDGRYGVLYNQYIAEGLSAEEAEEKAYHDAYVEPVKAAAEMGAVIGGFKSVRGTWSQSRIYTQRGKELRKSFPGMDVADAVIRQGSMYDKNSAAAKNAKLLEDKINRGGKLTDSQIGAQDILNRAEEYKFAMKTEAARKLTGVKTSYDGKLADDVEGSYSNGEIKLTTNPDDDYNSTFDHEGLHLVEDGANDIYNIYAQRIRENAQYSVMRDRIKGQYEAAGRKWSEDTLDSEASAEIMRKAMPKTAEDYERLIRRVEGNPTLYDRKYNFIRDLRIKMYAKRGKVFTDPDTGFKIEYSELLKMEKTLEDALTKVRGAELSGEPKALIKKIDGTDKLYVKADRQVIKGDTPDEWGKSVESYINDTIRKGKDVEFIGADGDVLTITADTSGKAKFRNNVTRPDGRITPMTDAEYMTKLTAESHIDELAEVSKRGKYWVPDSKNHDFAKDGFNYRTAYFEDFDGKYYKLTISVGKNGEIKSVYNVGKIKEVPSNFVAQRPGSKKDPSSATSKVSISQSTGGVKSNSGNSADGKEHYRLKTNQDMNVYGRNVVDDLNAYNRKRGYGKAFSELKDGILPDFIRQAWRLFESGEIADGRKLLYTGGEEIAKAVRKKKGETDHMIATDFVDHFTDLYKHSRTHKAYEGRLDISQKDVMETSVDVPRYVAELTTKNYANTDLMSTLYIENAIRSGYRMLKNGSDDFAIREALRPAAETILNDSKTKDGNPLRFESEAEFNAAVKKLTDDIIENYYLEQTAKNVTDSDVIKADTKKYGRDIEGLFRGIGLGITEGSVKRLGGSVRQMLDFVLDEDYSVTDFNGKLDSVIGEELAKLKVSPTDKAEIANTIICELREIAMGRIGKRRLELRMIMQAEIEAGRDSSEAWQNARDELETLAIREGNLTGVYFPHGNPGNDYALRNPAKKLHKVSVGSKAEFDNEVKDRMSEMTYRISHNKDTADYGMRYVSMNGTMESLTYLSSKQKWDENDMGIAAALVGEFGALGEPQLEADVFILAAQKATEAGKLSQAFSLMYRLTPAGNIAFLNKTEQTRIQLELERHAQKAEIEKKIEEFRAKDAEERKAADKALYETDADYRRDSDNKTQLQRDLDAVAKGEAEAKARIAEYEELQKRRKSDEELMAYMLNAGRRVEKRRQLKIEEEYARDTMREIGMSEDDIEMYLTGVDISPEKHRAFINTLKEYIETSETFMLKKEAEYKKMLLQKQNDSAAAKALRREIRQIAIRQRTLQNDHIVRAWRVNDDGEIDPKGRHIVADNPKASQWEIKKALGEDASHEAAEHYKSHVDMLYDELGIKHTDSETFSMMRELANALPDIDDADELIDIIMITSRYRKTATGRRMEKIRSKMYRGLEKLGESFGHKTNGESDNRMLKWLLGFGDKETNNIRRLLRKHFGSDVDQLKKIATSQMFGMIADTENVSTGRKLKTIMFQSQLLHPPTIKRNVFSNIVESARMNIVNNTASAIDRLTTKKGGQRVVGFENPFAGYKEGKSRSEQAYLETALNVDILNNDQSRIGLPSKKRTFKRGPLAVGERLLGYSLGATDEYFKGAIYHQVRSGLDRFVKDGRITEAEAEAYAQQQMLYRTFQNESLIASMSVGLRDLGNMVGTGTELPDTNKSFFSPDKKFHTHDFGLGDLINPYPLVSGNVLDRVIDVTPVGAVKALVKCGKLAKELYGNSKDLKALESVADKKVNGERGKLPDSILQTKRDALLSIANALISPVGWWLGAQLFKSGILLGGEPAEDEEDFERAKMNTQWTINFGAIERLMNGEGVTLPQQGDYIMPIGFLGPSAGVLTFGAEAFGDDTDEPILRELISSTGESVYAEFMAMSSVSGMRRYINDWKYADTPEEGAAAIAADAAMSFMPSTVRAIGNALDDYNRDPYRGESQFDVIGGKFLSKSPVPELRENVPLRIDLWGEAEVHTLGKGKVVDILNNVFSPAIFSKYETNVVTQELDKLTKDNKELLNDILPKTPYRNNTGNFENGQAYSFKLDDENYEKYANLLGMTTYKAMHTLVTSDDYKHLTESQKVTAMSSISKESATLVKEIWVQHQQGASDASMQKQIDKYVASNESKASKVVKTDNALKYIKLDGVKVEEVIDTGYYVPYTEEEKVSLIGERNDWISKIRNGTYYKKELGGKSSYWTAEDRQKMITKYQREMEDIASGDEDKWVTFEGEWDELTDEEKGILTYKVEQNIDKVRLPENVGELVDTTVEAEPVDLTHPFVPRTSSIINPDWRADEYDKEQSDKKNAEREESEEEPESKSVDEYLSEYKGSDSDYYNGNKGYSRNYSKNNYNKNYSGSYGGYKFTPSVQPAHQNTYRFTPRFKGGGSRFGKKF